MRSINYHQDNKNRFRIMRCLAPLMFFNIFRIDRINNIIITFAIINNQFFTSELILAMIS